MTHNYHQILLGNILIFDAVKKTMALIFLSKILQMLGHYSALAYKSEKSIYLPGLNILDECQTV